MYNWEMNHQLIVEYGISTSFIHLRKLLTNLLTHSHWWGCFNDFELCTVPKVGRQCGHCLQ